MAGLIVRQPKLLILDETTNHLDSEALLWLEQWLCDYRGTVLFVSHDRAFLDRVATSIYELSPSGSVKYYGGYSAYVGQKKVEQREREAAYRKQQLEREALEKSIRMYAQWYRQADRDASNVEAKIATSYFKARATKHTSRLRAKEKELERLDREAVQSPRSSPQLKVALGASEFRASTMLRLECVGFAWPGSGRELFSGLTLHIERGDRLPSLDRTVSGKVRC